MAYKFQKGPFDSDGPITGSTTITAVSFHGSGASLTGISADAIDVTASSDAANMPLVFTQGAQTDGSLGLALDASLVFNPSTNLLTAPGRVITDDTTDATSKTDGSLQTDGGLSVAKAIYNGTAATLAADSGVVTIGSATAATFSAAGLLNINNATDASSKTDGSLQTDGGLSVAKKAYVGTGLTVEAGGVTVTAGRVTLDDSTDATSTTDGSLQTDGGLSVAKDAILGNDVKLLSDSAVLSLGIGSDATFTHDGTTGLTIAATPISIDSTGELHLNSTSGDIKLQDGGVDQIAFDLDGTAGEVIMKPAVDSDDLCFQQYDGTEVIRIEDDASLSLVDSKLGISNSSSDVVFKPLTDAKDLIFQQYDGNVVMTVEDAGTLMLTTGLVPDANDGAYLGQAGTAFSDLFLAEGGVINWDSGDVTMTQAGNLLSVAGGNLRAERLEIDSASDYIDVDTDLKLVATADIVLDPAGGDVKVDGNLLPNADNGGALGASGTEWSDLFLNTGGVINWEAGDVTLTHAANALTLAGGSFTVNGDVTMGGSGAHSIEAKGMLYTESGQIFAAEAKSAASQTLTVGSQVVLCSGSAAMNVKLPVISEMGDSEKGYPIWIKRAYGSSSVGGFRDMSKNVTISCSAADTIEGASSITLETAGAAVMLLGTGSVWQVF